MGTQIEEINKIEEEIKSLRRKLEDNEAKLKENKMQKEEVQQVTVDESSNETSPMGFECEQSVVGTVMCPLKIEMSTILKGTPVKESLEENNEAFKMHGVVKCQEEWHKDGDKDCAKTSSKEESNLWEEFAAIMGEWQRNGGSMET